MIVVRHSLHVEQRKELKFNLKLARCGASSFMHAHQTAAMRALVCNQYNPPTQLNAGESIITYKDLRFVVFVPMGCSGGARQQWKRKTKAAAAAAAGLKNEIC